MSSSSAVFFFGLPARPDFLLASLPFAAPFVVAAAGAVLPLATAFLGAAAALFGLLQTGQQQKEWSTLMNEAYVMRSARDLGPAVAGAWFAPTTTST